MAMVYRFEDLGAWKKARRLTHVVYTLTRKPVFARDFGLCGQVQRAVVSIMSNIAEGFERAKRKEFHQALCVAKGSCAEVRSLLFVAHDVGYINDEEFQSVKAQAEEVACIIGGLRSAVARQIPGFKANSRSRGAATRSSVLSPQSARAR